MRETDGLNIRNDTKYGDALISWMSLNDAVNGMVNATACLIKPRVVQTSHGLEIFETLLPHNALNNFRFKATIIQPI